MTCNFRVGQKVVCVNAVGSDSLRLGDVYTIESVFWNGIGVTLVEAQPNKGHVGFRSDRFRPVIERGTDLGMSILRSLLNKTGKPVEVDA